MKTSLSLLVVLLVGTAIVIDQWANEAVVHEGCAAAGATAPTGAGPALGCRAAFQREIRAVVDSARVAEVRLLAQLGEAATPDHPAVVAHRRAVTIRLLEIQARHAAAAGHHGLARRIRANLTVLREGGCDAAARPIRVAGGS